MAKNQNTFEKRRREAEKKRKADDKRARRKTRKEQTSLGPRYAEGDPRDLSTDQ